MISAESRKPELAAQCVNELLEELNIFINDAVVSSAKKNRIFIEKQVSKNIEDFFITGKEISEYEKTKRMPDSFVNVDINLDATVMDLASDQSEVNEEYKKILQKKKELESKSREIKIAKVPQQVYYDYLLLKRDVLGKLNGALQQQYEMAKMDEAHESVSFQVISYPKIPTSPYKPKTFLIVTLSTFVGLFVGLFYVFFTQYIQNLKKAQKQ